MLEGQPCHNLPQGNNNNKKWVSCVIKARGFTKAVWQPCVPTPTEVPVERALELLRNPGQSSGMRTASPLLSNSLLCTQKPGLFTTFPSTHPGLGTSNFSLLPSPNPPWGYVQTLATQQLSVESPVLSSKTSKQHPLSSSDSLLLGPQWGTTDRPR